MTATRRNSLPNSRKAVRRQKVSASGFTRVDGVGGNLVYEVADQIRTRIEIGALALGKRMPSERDLAAELGISRTVLRESLSSLESLGYLEAKVGQGRFVTDPEGSGGQRLIDNWLRRHKSELRDLIEMRAAIESQALRGSRSNLPEMVGDGLLLIREQAEAIADDRLDEAAEVDMDFHLLLAGGTDNRPLRTLARALIGRADQAAHAAYRVSSYRRASLRQHRAIVGALREGDREKAARLLSEHHLSRIDQLDRHLRSQRVRVGHEIE